MYLDQNRYFFDGGVDPVSIAKKYGCPVYVYETSVMKNQFDRLAKAFPLDNLKINYACKALNNLSVLQYFKSLGAGLDTVSIQEVKLGLLAGFLPSEIIYCARDPGDRAKIAVKANDHRTDPIGACFGMRGSREQAESNELNGERIDIVRWNDALQVLIPNALQPAQISDVFTYPRLGRAIVLVTDDQLSLAIGRRGQNVRLASKLVGWDIEIMTHDELAEALERAELTTSLIEEGFLSYNDITMTDATGLSEFTGLPDAQADEVVMYAEEYPGDIYPRSAAEGNVRGHQFTSVVWPALSSTGLAPLVRRIAALFPQAQVRRGERFASVVAGLGDYARALFGGG